MKTGFDIVTDIWKRLLPIEGDLLGGKVLQFQEPVNSSDWNVVINILGASNDPMQFAIVNVNIHGPNLKGTADSTQPDLARFYELTNTITPLLESYWSEDYHTDIRDHGIPRRDTDGSWYTNIRVNYYSMQTNKNI